MRYTMQMAPTTSMSAVALATLDPLRFSRRRKSSIGALISAVAIAAGHTASAAPGACPAHNAGLKLPAGFCASVFADGIGHARHMAVAKDGTLYVNTWSGRYYADDTPHEGGFLVALRDTSGAGKADKIVRFGETVASGGHGGTGISLYRDSLYAEINDKIVKYTLNSDGSAPTRAPTTVVSGLPVSGDHPMHPFAIDPAGNLFVDVATATNACQQQNRTAKIPGMTPCTELETRGGIWKFDANGTNQAFSPAQRYATGIRNGEGFAIDKAEHRIFVTQHGRDQLHTNWPDVIKRADLEATLPSEEVLLLKQGGDYGWPTCYYDPYAKKLVLAPEYGGDGKKAGLCADKTGPVAAFPAHWAPNDMQFGESSTFPAHYYGGLFIAFHGSWNRAPYGQAGYNVVFQKLAGEKAAGSCQIFADGFAGNDKSPDGAKHRPTGLAFAPDGSLYISDDVHGGRIYRITYKAGANPGGRTTACPSNTASAGAVKVANVRPPEGTHADAGHQVLPPGFTAETVTLGTQIYAGQKAGATCTGCHGAGAAGSPLGPNLISAALVWSDGSVAGIAATITKGVAEPKHYRAPMPALGGAQLTSDQVTAVAAYIWSLRHQHTASATKAK